MVPQLWETLREIINRGYNEKIFLVIFSNMQKISQEQIEILSAFPKGKLMCSVDAFGTENDFLRHPSNFDKIVDNLKKLSTLPPDWMVCFSSAISFYNVLSYTKLIDWAEKFFPEFLPNGALACHEVAVPAYLSPRLINQQSRLLIESELMTRRENYWLYGESRFKHISQIGLNDYMGILKSPDAENSSQLKQLAHLSIKEFDLIRNQDGYKLFPHISDL